MLCEVYVISTMHLKGVTWEGYVSFEWKQLRRYSALKEFSTQQVKRSASFQQLFQTILSPFLLPGMKILLLYMLLCIPLVFLLSSHSIIR